MRDSAGRWLERAGGRKPGVPNKLTTSTKAAIQEVFEQIGGVERMAQWAAENPGQFYTSVLVKLLPVEMRVQGQVQTDFADVLQRARERVVATMPASKDDD
jgi:hypothetical protein